MLINPLHTNREIIDTLVLARLIWPNAKDLDLNRRVIGKDNGLPGKMIGSHSLEAWGYRLGQHKGDYFKEKVAELVLQGVDKLAAEKMAWSVWNKEMQTYCEQDVVVTKALYNKILEKDYPEEPIKLEHQFQCVMHLMERSGFPFDVQKAQQLYGQLQARQAELEEEFKEIPPWVHEEEFTPKANNKRYGYTKGVTVIKREVTPFKPSSRDHIIRYLKETYDWKPIVLTENGNPKLDEDVLIQLDYPQAKKFLEYFMVDKIMSFLVGKKKKGWLFCHRDGMMHGAVNPMGTISGRCSHYSPNMGQVPGSEKPYGKECRELFTADKGFTLLGIDASGLELRCLAHYLYPYDGGIYAKEVADGDIHTVNQKAAGLPTRATAKTFIYALLYGAGNEKIGAIIDGSSREGAKLKKNFFSNSPALADFKKDLDEKLKHTNILTGLDGRPLHVRAKYAALNLLFQSAGAILMKKATVLFYYNLYKSELQYGIDWKLSAHVHDEMQVQVRPELVEKIAEIGIQSIKQAGQELNFKCELDGDYSFGRNWAETH